MEKPGELIRIKRQEKGLSLQQVGDAVGVGKSTVRKWECGMIANMRRDKIAKLAEVLDVPADFLLTPGKPLEVVKDQQSPGPQPSTKDRDRRDELLRLFDQLDDEGQGRVLECASDQITHGRVKKSDSSAEVG